MNNCLRPVSKGKNLFFIALFLISLQLKAQLSSNSQSVRHKLSSHFSVSATPKGLANHNLSTFTSPVMYKNLDKLHSVNANSAVSHPDFGKVAPGVNPSWYEQYNKRTATTREFLAEDGSVVSSFSYVPVNYLDKSGNYIAIDARLTSTAQGWSATHQQFPTYLYPDGSTEISLSGNDRLKFNINNSIAGKDISVSNFTVGDNGMMVHDAVSGIDKKIVFGENTIETDYLINKPLTDLATDLTISEEIILPAGYSIKEKSLDELFGAGTNHFELVVVNANGKECSHLKMPVCYDSNTEKAKFRQSFYSGKYSLRNTGGRTFLDVIISSAWLNDAARVYPVTIDPLVTGPTATYPNATVGSCTFPAFSTSNALNVTVPAGVTVTTFSVTGSYFTDNGATPINGAIYLSTPCGATDTLYADPDDPDSYEPGIESVYGDAAEPLACCITPSCVAQTIPLYMHLTSGPGSGCNSTYIYYNYDIELANIGFGATPLPFAGFIQGRTAELASGSSGWSVSPTSVCSNVCTLGITVPTANGVPPYTMTHPWAASGVTFGAFSVANAGDSTCSGTSSGTGVLTLNIPNCPGTCGADSTITVPAPTITDACGNRVSISSKTFTKVPIPIVTANPTSKTICSGTSPAITLTSCATGSTITWTGSNGHSGSGTITDSPVNNGGSAIVVTYTVSVSNGTCTGTPITVPVTVNPPPTVTVSPTNASVCPGDSATLTAGGGISYTWTPVGGLSSTSGAVVKATPGTYSVTGTDGNGCKATKGVIVAAGSSLTIAVNPTTSTICSGKSVTLIASGATNYSWSPSSELSYISANGDTAITLNSIGSQIIFSINGSTGGCTGSTYDTVKVGTSPTVSFSASPSTTVCAGTSVTLSGTGANSYTWTGGINNGVSFVPSGVNTYTVTGTAANGCTATSAVTVTSNPLPTVGANASPSSTVCAGSHVTLTGSGASSYSWTSGVTNGASFVPPGGTNTYTVTGTSGGCSATSTITITANALPTVGTSASPASTVCAGSSVTLSGTGANSYSWTGGVNNGVSFTPPTGTNTYTVTGTAVNGCSATNTITVTANALPTVGANASPSTTLCSGSTATLSGTGANSYTWTGGVTNGASFTPPTGTDTYTVTGTAGNGCSATSTITLTVNPVPSVSATASPSSTVCAGSSVTLSGTGANSYTWTGGVTNGASFVPPTGTNTYTVTGTITGCGSSTNTITVTVNALPSVGANASPSSTVCAGSQVTLSGTGANSYSWSGGVANGVSFVPSGINTYTVTGTAGNGCSATGTIVVTANSLPTVGANATPSSTVCAGSSVTLSGTGASSYSWSGGVTNGASFVPSGIVTYTVTGTGGNGCSATGTVTVTVNALPTVGSNVSPSSTVCSGASVTLSGTGANSYTWTGGVTNGVSFVPPTGTDTYSVTGTDGHGCSNTAVSTINVTPSFTLNAGPNINICPGDSASIFVTGAPGGSVYSWSPATDLTCNNCANPIAYPSDSIHYVVTATGGSGCSATTSISVIVAPLAATAVASQTLVCYGSVDTLTATGGTTYLWTPSADLTDSTDASITVTALATTSYTVTVSNGNCSAAKTVLVNVNPKLIVPRITQSATGDTLFCSTNPDYTSYQWYHDDTLLVGQTHPYYVAAVSGNYNVVVKDENGCAISVGTNINVSTGVFNLTFDNSISLYPNPANDALTIRSSGMHGNEQVLISVMDVLGKKVQQEQVNWRNETTVNIKNLSAGVYFLQLEEAQGKWIGRFVKE